MKSIGQIMEEMGFNPKSTPSSKAAFIKYLAKQAYNVDLQVPEIYKTEEESGEATLDSFLNREPEAQTNVEPIFKKEKPTKEVQLELGLDLKEDYKIAE
jgi:hypothetical protein